MISTPLNSRQFEAAMDAFKSGMAHRALDFTDPTIIQRDDGVLSDGTPCFTLQFTANVGDRVFTTPLTGAITLLHSRFNVWGRAGALAARDIKKLVTP